MPAEASKRTKELENVRLERRLLAEKELAVDIPDRAATVILSLEPRRRALYAEQEK